MQKTNHSKLALKHLPFKHAEAKHFMPVKKELGEIFFTRVLRILVRDVRFYLSQARILTWGLPACPLQLFRFH